METMISRLKAKHLELTAALSALELEPGSTAEWNVDNGGGFTVTEPDKRVLQFFLPHPALSPAE